MLRRSLSVLLLCLFAGRLLAATDLLSGTWKLNPTKSRLTYQMKVDPSGPNTYTFHLSATNREIIVANGRDQPGIFGTTLAVTVLSPRQWRVVRRKDGRMLISAIYTRADGASGFAGVWESQPKR